MFVLTALVASSCAGGVEPEVLGTPAPASGEPEPEMLTIDERRAAPFRTVSSGAVVPQRSTGDAVEAIDPDTMPAATPSPAPPGRGRSEATGRTHRVEWGQTWFGIARLYAVTRAALAAANPGFDPERLRAGDVLRIPVGAGEGARMHTVGSGDTLWNISRRYGVGVDALREANGVEGNEIHIGQVLIIPER